MLWAVAMGRALGPAYRAAYRAAWAEIEGLLTRCCGKFAVPHAFAQALGENCGLFFAMNGDQLAKRRADRGLSEEIDVNSVEQRFGESFADIMKRGATRVGRR